MSFTNKARVQVTLTQSQIDTVQAMTSVAAAIRYLDRGGYTRYQISKLLSKALNREIRYQWVRNVLLTPVKNQD